MYGIENGYMHEVFPGFGLLLQLILFVIFLAIIYWVIKSGNLSNQSAEDILKKRLVKSEITKKEYKELLKEIK